MSKPFSIHDWQAKQRLAEQVDMDKVFMKGVGPGGEPNPDQLTDEPLIGGLDKKERLVKTIVNVFNGRLGNWYQDGPTSMNDVQKLFDRDREAIEDIVRQHLMDINLDEEINPSKVPGTVGWMSDKGAGLTVGGGEADTSYTDEDKIYDAVLHTLKKSTELEISQIIKLADSISSKSMESIEGEYSPEDTYLTPTDDDLSFFDEIEVTGMEPDSGNMEKEFKVIGPANQSKPLTDVTIEYKGQEYILDFEFGDVIDDHGNEGRDEWWEAESEDGHTFMVDAYVPGPELTPEVDWDTLEIESYEEREDWAHASDQAAADREDQIPMGEQNTVAANTGFSAQTGNSEVYATKYAWRKQRKNNKR